VSVVIIGGHDRMCRNYHNICKEYGCDAQVCTQPCRNMEGKICGADLVVLFTNPVSHEMAKIARTTAIKSGVELVQSHCASASALRGILETRNSCEKCDKRCGKSDKLPAVGHANRHPDSIKY
jgi:hypothetical protein